MKILFIGDVVGRPGRKCLSRVLPDIINRQQVDFIIANGENAAGGAGITREVFFELRNIGIDLLTGGNHTWDQKEILEFIDQETGIIRPANYPPNITPGTGTVVLNRNGNELAVVNLMGRAFMDILDCPFRTADRELSSLGRHIKTILVDFHAEATSEKQAMGWYLNGKVSAVIGTHTHVQTADHRILPDGTAYITDVGMTGLYDSILGVDKAGPLNRFLTQLPHRFEISGGKTFFNAVVIETDDTSGKAVSIERIFKVVG